MPTTVVRKQLPPLIPEEIDPRRRWMKAVFLAAGIVLIVIGFIAIPVPVLSGVPFWAGGVLVLGVPVPPLARFINRQEARLPARWRRKLRTRPWRKARDRLRAPSG